MKYFLLGVFVVLATCAALVFCANEKNDPPERRKVEIQCFQEGVMIFNEVLTQGRYQWDLTDSKGREIKIPDSKSSVCSRRYL